MERDNYQQHWETVFKEKDTSKVSWYQESPVESLELIQEIMPDVQKSIIDIGGGDSRIPDGLLQLAYENITVLDISKSALEESMLRLGDEAKRINWIAEDVLKMDTKQKYDLWYDRAVFHFITDPKDRLKYKENLLSSIEKDGTVIIAGFSTEGGPLKCSGIDVFQLNENRMMELFSDDFNLVEQFKVIHVTPSGTEQMFYWAILKKK